MNAGTSKSSAITDIIRTLLQPKILPLIVISFIFSLAFVQMESIFSLFAKERFHLSAYQIGAIFTYLGIIIAISQGGLIGKISKKVNDITLFIFGSGLLALGFWMITLSLSPLEMILWMGVIALGASATNPTLSSLLSKHSSTDT